MQFDASAGLLAVSALDRLGDDRYNLYAILQNQMLGRPHHPALDFVSHVGGVTHSDSPIRTTVWAMRAHNVPDESTNPSGP
ncbi:hypothetical protein A8144_10810 [Mycobacterium leprae 3125609]|nr:hypothetical protein A8144_10810 [Mycobacterium leprae 3125609]OAX70736.1 hypothetical protein A3216_10275 [Mycobacterium leprae 7935681]